MADELKIKESVLRLLKGDITDLDIEAFVFQPKRQCFDALKRIPKGSQFSELASNMTVYTHHLNVRKLTRHPIVFQSGIHIQSKLVLFHACRDVGMGPGVNIRVYA